VVVSALEDGEHRWLGFWPLDAFLNPSSLFPPQRQAIAQRAAEEARREEEEKERYVHETQSRLNELSFDFSWGD
jgi:hypothetical protein